MRDEEILELFAQVDEPRSTPQVANQLGISKPATWKRLSDLHDLGLLEKHPAEGLRSESWSLTDDGRRQLEGELVAEEA